MFIHVNVDEFGRDGPCGSGSGFYKSNNNGDGQTWRNSIPSKSSFFFHCRDRKLSFSLCIKTPERDSARRRRGPVAAAAHNRWAFDARFESQFGRARAATSFSFFLSFLSLWVSCIHHVIAWPRDRICSRHAPVIKFHLILFLSSLKKKKKKMPFSARSTRQRENQPVKKDEMKWEKEEKLPNTLVASTWCVSFSLCVLIHRVVCIPCRGQINVLLNSMPLVWYQHHWFSSIL